MRSDREGLEDTRQCDMKPQTGGVLPPPTPLALPYGIKRSAKKAPQMKTGVKQRSGDIAEGDILNKDLQYT